MKFKEFLKYNKDIFLNTPVDAFQVHKEFIKELIKKYPNRCPDVFEEMKTHQNLNTTKFYKWWENRKIYTKNLYPEQVAEIKNIKQETIKKTIIKEKVIQEKYIPQTPYEEFKPEIIERQPIHQEIQINKVYQKINFKTEMADNFYRMLDMNLKRIKLKSFEVANIVNEYKEKIKANPDNVDLYFKQLSCFEKMYKLQSDTFNDTQTFQVQLRMLIENEKQIFENGFYEKTVDGNSQLSEEQNDAVREILQSINEAE